MTRKKSHEIYLAIREWLKKTHYPNFTLYKITRSVFHIEPHELNPNLTDEIHHALIKLGYKRISKRRYALEQERLIRHGRKV